MSPVTTSRLEKFLLSMWAFWVRELEKAVILELGKISARYREREPQPHLDAHGCQYKSGKGEKVDRTIPKIKDPHPILQLRLLNISLQHGNLRLRQRLRALGVKTAAVLHPWAKHVRQNAGADFVVLRVGGGGLDGDGATSKQLDVFHLGIVAGGQTCGFD